MEATKLTATNGEAQSHSPSPLTNFRASGDGSIDYIISDYMERLGTRLNILETELKYAWKALDMLSQEYIKMWERLEKLEGMLFEQQTVISQLIEFYTTGMSHDGPNAVSEGMITQHSSVSELDAIAKSLGASIGIEDTSVLREKLAQQELARMHGIAAQDSSATAAITDIHRNTRNLETLEEEGNTPDEAFYKSLNNAYRDDLICGDSSRPTSQLGMIWEEAEDVDDTNGKKDTESGLASGAALDKSTAALANDKTETSGSELEAKKSKEEIAEQTTDNEKEIDEEDEGEIFSAADYKSYRGNTPCVSEQDLAELSRLSTIDQVALEKLQEVDRLSNKLQKDTQNLIELQNKLMESPKRQYATETEAKLAEEASNIDEQLRKIYAEADVENWTYSKSPGSTGRSISRVSTDSGLTTDGDFTTRSISPRLNSTPRSNLDSLSSTYNAASQFNYASTLMESPAVAETAIQLSIDVGSFAKGYAENKELTDLMAESLAAVTCASPTVFATTTDKIASPTLSVGSVNSVNYLRTRQDGYFGSAARLNLEFPESRTPPSPSPSSPPPPAPRDSSETFLMPTTSDHLRDIDEKRAQSPSFLKSATDKLTLEQGRLSPLPRAPHSPKSPKISPKHITKQSAINIVPAKSDSGLSSMSGWSSLDKSPSSPKNSINKLLTSYSMDHARAALIANAQPLRTASPIPPLPEAAAKPALIQEPLYDTPEGKDAFGNVISAATSQSLQSSINHITNPFLTKTAAAGKEEFDVTSQTPKKRSPRQQLLQNAFNAVPTAMDHLLYRPEQPAIYSVAGSNRQQMFTSVYTSGTGTYGSRTTSTNGLDERYYPDLNYGSLQYGEHGIGNGKKTRASSLGDAAVTNDIYKSAMYRSKFPTGNITDALSYYPTSANLPRTEAQESWLNATGELPHDSTSSSIRSLASDGGSYTQSPYNDRRYPQPPSYQSHQYHTYVNQNYNQMYQQYQQQYQPYTQRIGMSASDLTQLKTDYQRQWREQYAAQHHDAARGQDQHQPQREYYDASNVIVSQSGYISIASDIKEPEVEPVKLTKKMRRGSSLKHAMSSMSNWLPDLNLSKRYRSHSLPGGGKDDLDGAQDSLSQFRAGVDMRGRGRKKKKHNLVSTVSGILQKAKRRSHTSSSLSDPEQSETEWSSGRQSGLSEDEDSVMSDLGSAQEQPLVFAKVKSSSMKRPPPQQRQQLTEQQQQMELLQQQAIQQQQKALQQQIQQHQEHFQQQSIQDGWAMKEKEQQQQQKKSDTEQDIDQTGGFEEEASGRSTGSGSGGSMIFPTVGDIKRSTGSSDEAPNEKAPKLPPVTLGGASMEFAVSRALGKYRQRQSSTVSDEHTPSEDMADKKSDDSMSAMQTLEPSYELLEEASEKSEKSERSEASKLPELVASISEEAPSDGSPSASSQRGQTQVTTRFVPRHQQSLDIPWGGSRSGEGDEDNRSTHSYRSTSRVSSRRQSTEDSIDSDDEWFCHELRKLDELEKMSMEQEHQRLIEEDEEPYQPDEDVKEKMSFVLRELKLKAIPRDEVVEKKEPPRVMVRMNGSVPREHRLEENGYRDEKPAPKGKAAESVESVFARVTDYQTWAHEEAKKDTLKVVRPMDEDSSGETSGPDSPVHSTDEMDDYEAQKEIDEQQSRRSSGSTLRRDGEKMPPGSDSLSREGSVSVPPSEVSVSIPGAWDSESTAVLEGERDGAGSAETGTTATLSLPKIKIDSSSCGSSDASTLKEGQVSPGPPGSKWKLLKALKERKAEEKEAAKAETQAITQGPTAVSIMIK